MTFRLYFLNSLLKGAFPELWEKWWKAISDGSPGKLFHPILGEMDAIVQGGDVTLEAQATAGVIVEVKFERTVVDPEEDEMGWFLALDATELASACDAAAEEREIPFPSQGSVLNFMSLINAINGLAFYGNSMADGVINMGKGMIDGVYKAFDTLQDHTTFPAKNQLSQLYSVLLEMGKRSGVAGAVARDIKAVITESETTLDLFAKERDNTLKDVMNLNQGAMVKPLVPKGTMLRYYA